jgi:putative transposase
MEWPHAPLHRPTVHGAYMVTAATYCKRHLFKDEDNLVWLHERLIQHLLEHSWAPQAWAVFSNHYHFVACAEEGFLGLPELLNRFHSLTSNELNERDGSVGRKVWHNYRETSLTFERSYLARLNYVHQNGVRHGLVKVARDYPYCSAAWFERTATQSFQKTVGSFPIDRLSVPDDY